MRCCGVTVAIDALTATVTWPIGSGGRLLLPHMLYSCIEECKQPGPPVLVCQWRATVHLICKTMQEYARTKT
jgi:hypothetical protein